MKTTLFFPLLLALLSAHVCQTSGGWLAPYAQAHLDRSLSQYLLQSNALDPADSLANAAACFDRYLPVLSEVASTYSMQFQVCALIANVLSANATAQAAQNRQDLMTETSSVCSAFEACSANDDALTFFNCYSTVTSDDVGGLYQISRDAASAARTVTQRAQYIRSEQEQCRNVTQRTFIANSAITYQRLDECLKYGPEAATTESDVSPVSTANPLGAF